MTDGVIVCLALNGQLVLDETPHLDGGLLPLPHLPQVMEEVEQHDLMCNICMEPCNMPVMCRACAHHIFCAACIARYIVATPTKWKSTMPCSPSENHLVHVVLHNDNFLVAFRPDNSAVLFTCPQCRRETDSMAMATASVLAKVNRRPVTCPHCDSFDGTWEALRAHVNEHHSAIEKEADARAMASTEALASEQSELFVRQWQMRRISRAIQRARHIMERTGPASCSIQHGVTDRSELRVPASSADYNPCSVFELACSHHLTISVVLQ